MENICSPFYRGGGSLVLRYQHPTHLSCPSNIIDKNSPLTTASSSEAVASLSSMVFNVRIDMSMMKRHLPTIVIPFHCRGDQHPSVASSMLESEWWWRQWVFIYAWWWCRRLRIELPNGDEESIFPQDTIIISRITDRFTYHRPPSPPPPPLMLNNSGSQKEEQLLQVAEMKK